MKIVPRSNLVFSQRISHFYDTKLSEKLFKDKHTHARMNEIVVGMALKENSVCLDIGTGTGANLLLPALKNTRSFGCDISTEMLTRARAKNVKSQFFVCDIEHMPLKKERFDFIIQTEVLHHIFDYETLLRELVQLLRPGGRLYIDYEWNQTSLFVPINYAIFNTKLFFAKIRALLGDEVPLQHLEDFRKADYHYLKSHEKRGFDPEALQRFLDSLPGCQAEVTTHFHSSDATGIRFSPFWWVVKFFDNFYQALLGSKQRGHWVQILVTKLP